MYLKGLGSAVGKGILMKKKTGIIITSVILLIIGIGALAYGIYWKSKEAAAISIIGGADGPTSVFVAGKLGDGLSTAFVAVGVALLAIIVLLVRYIRKH